MCERCTAPPCPGLSAPTAWRGPSGSVTCGLCTLFSNGSRLSKNGMMAMSLTVVRLAQTKGISRPNSDQVIAASLHSGNLRPFITIAGDLGPGIKAARNHIIHAMWLSAAPHHGIEPCPRTLVKQVRPEGRHVWSRVYRAETQTWIQDSSPILSSGHGNASGADEEGTVQV